MLSFKQLCLGAIVSLGLASAGIAFAASDPNNPPVTPDNFVEEASAKGIAEIETAKLALEKGNEEVKAFAQTMVDDHTLANEKLTALAKQKNLEVSDSAELMNQAKALVLKLRGEASFDKAYMNNQVVAHQQTIQLFEGASTSDDAEIAAFAKETLPTLRHHLEMAEQLNASLPEN